MILEQTNMRYKCNFCDKLFEDLLECAKHLYKESITKIISPSDIIMVDITKEREEMG